MHVDECDIWNDLRPFLKYLAQPFSSKLRSNEVKGLKSGNLAKQKFLSNINFLLDSILYFMYYGQFSPASRLKLRFVLFKLEKVSNAAGNSNPCQVATFSGLEKDKLQF